MYLISCSQEKMIQIGLGNLSNQSFEKGLLVRHPVGLQAPWEEKTLCRDFRILCSHAFSFLFLKFFFSFFLLILPRYFVYFLLFLSFLLASLGGGLKKKKKAHAQPVIEEPFSQEETLKGFLERAERSKNYEKSLKEAGFYSRGLFQTVMGKEKRFAFVTMGVPLSLMGKGEFMESRFLLITKEASLSGLDKEAQKYELKASHQCDEGKYIYPISSDIFLVYYCWNHLDNPVSEYELVSLSNWQSSLELSGLQHCQKQEEGENELGK